MPQSACDEIRMRVRQGAGLLMRVAADERDQAIQDQATELDTLPPWLDGLDVSAYRLGQGRLLCFRQEGWSIYLARPPAVFALGPIFGLDLHRDLRVEEMGRSLLWAVDREPPVQVMIDIGRRAIDHEALPGHHATVSWRSQGIGERLSCEVRLRSQAQGTRTLGKI